MTPGRVLKLAPLVLDQRQRERYFEDGFLTVPGYVGAAWLHRLRAVVAAKALPITPAPTPTSRTGVLVRGHEPTHVHMEPYPARLPPRWDHVGYRSIFAAQTAAARPAWID